VRSKLEDCCFAKKKILIRKKKTNKTKEGKSSYVKLRKSYEPGATPPTGRAQPEKGQPEGCRTPIKKLPACSSQRTGQKLRLYKSWTLSYRKCGERTSAQERGPWEREKQMVSLDARNPE